MEKKPLRPLFLADVEKYIDGLSETEQAKIAAHVKILSTGDFQTVHTKQLDGPIRELIIGHHRLVYFKKHRELYFTEVFRKKSAKTPRKAIENAKRIYNGV